MERRRLFVMPAGWRARPAVPRRPCACQANIRWRLASSFPKSLDTIYGGGDVFAKVAG